MKNKLLVLNHGYYFWGISVYVGLLWSIHFIFSPSWISITPATVQDHFMVPVDAATAFFSVVVPFMLLAGLVLIYMEWKTKQRWVTVIAYGSLLVMMVVGYFLIRPINESIATDIEAATLQAPILKEQLVDWMFYNNVRAVIMTFMWLVVLYYFISKGELFNKFSRS